MLLIFYLNEMSFFLPIYMGYQGVVQQVMNQPLSRNKTLLGACRTFSTSPTFHISYKEEENLPQSVQNFYPLLTTLLYKDGLGTHKHTQPSKS